MKITHEELLSEKEPVKPCSVSKEIDKQECFYGKYWIICSIISGTYHFQAQPHGYFVGLSSAPVLLTAFLISSWRVECLCATWTRLSECYFRSLLMGFSGLSKLLFHSTRTRLHACFCMQKRFCNFNMRYLVAVIQKVKYFRLHICSHIEKFCQKIRLDLILSFIKQQNFKITKIYASFRNLTLKKPLSVENWHK